MSIPTSFLALTNHPAPGLHFPAHEAADRDEYVLPAPHAFADPANGSQLEELRKRTAACPTLQTELLDFYTRWNGAALCCLPDPLSGAPASALTILPIEAWDKATEPFTTDDLGWMLDGLEDMYVPGRFFVIAVSPSEGTHLVLFTEGLFEGESLAGKVFYLSMDPVLGATEPVANSFNSLLDEFATDPAGFLERIGYCHAVMGKSGLFGAVADRYLPDCGLRLDEEQPEPEE